MHVRFKSACYTDGAEVRLPHQLLLPDGHHAEGNVLRRHVVSAAHLVDLVSLGHDDGVVLDDDGVGVHAVL